MIAWLKGLFKRKPKAPPELTWQTADGRILKISEMSTEHLDNTLKWMRRIAARRPEHQMALPHHEKYKAMQAELERRLNE